MKPSARIQATIDILEKVANNHRIPMDGVVGDYMRVRRYIGSKDRAEIAERTYNLIRAYARLGWWIARTKAEDTPRNNVIAYLALAEGCAEKRISDLFDGSQYAPNELTDDERKFIGRLVGNTLDHSEMPPAIRVECPPQFEDALKDYFGDAFEEEMAAMISSAPLDMRVNTFLCGREKAAEYLEAAGVKTDPTPFSPVGLRARGKAYLAKTKAFAKGWVEIQDEGSQLIAHVCNVHRGMQVLDYCAGAGGKTLALAAAMERKGRIVAMDIDERRLEKGKERFKKAQISDIVEVRPLEDTRHRKWLKRQKETFDVVLCDVPCSGTGTWRRNPDMRWKQYGPKLEDLMVIQGEILDKVASVVKPGGKLVYATCSLLKAENENQVEKFLANHPEYKLEPVAKELGDGYMRLTPLRHNTDGFFAAVMVKTGSTKRGSDVDTDDED
jgi:16S rRNA (cytosine967-C5)-methyltransferase